MMITLVTPAFISRHQAYERLARLQQSFSETEYVRLGTSGPRALNSQEHKLLSKKQPSRTTSMLDWVQSNSLAQRPRSGSAGSTASTLRLTNFSSIFTQPVTAAVSSVLSLKDFFSGAGS